MRPVAGTGVVGAFAAAALLATAGAAASGGVKLHVLAQGGTVTAYGTHFRCQDSCSLSAAQGAVVVLQARPQRFFSFRHWNGACHGKGTACVMSLTSATSAQAVFSRNNSEVLVTVGGAGSVRVVGRSKPGCGRASGNCDISWPAGTAVRLAAVPDGGSFAGWGRACAGSSGPTCRIVVGNRTVAYVTAAFATAPAPASPGVQQQLSVHTDNLGLGSSAGFTCPAESVCTASVAAGTLLKLRVPAAGVPRGQIWRGACIGVGFACALVVEGPVNVLSPGFAAFSPPGKDALNINVAGSGVVTNGHGLNCTMARSPCTMFSRGPVRLTARPASAFSTWISFGVCPAKRASCTAKLSSSGTTVTARFKRRR